MGNSPGAGTLIRTNWQFAIYNAMQENWDAQLNSDFMSDAISMAERNQDRDFQALYKSLQNKTYRPLSNIEKLDKPAPDDKIGNDIYRYERNQAAFGEVLSSFDPNLNNEYFDFIAGTIKFLKAVDPKYFNGDKGYIYADDPRIILIERIVEIQDAGYNIAGVVSSVIPVIGGLIDALIAGSQQISGDILRKILMEQFRLDKLAVRPADGMINYVLTAYAAASVLGWIDSTKPMGFNYEKYKVDIKPFDETKKQLLESINDAFATSSSDFEVYFKLGFVGNRKIGDLSDPLLWQILLGSDVNFNPTSEQLYTAGRSYMYQLFETFMTLPANISQAQKILKDQFNAQRFQAALLAQAVDITAITGGISTADQARLNKSMYTYKPRITENDDFFWNSTAKNAWAQTVKAEYQLRKLANQWGYDDPTPVPPTLKAFYNVPGLTEGQLNWLSDMSFWGNQDNGHVKYRSHPYGFIGEAYGRTKFDPTDPFPGPMEFIEIFNRSFKSRISDLPGKEILSMDDYVIKNLGKWPEVSNRMTNTEYNQRADALRAQYRELDRMYFKDIATQDRNTYADPNYGISKESSKYLDPRSAQYAQIRNQLASEWDRANPLFNTKNYNQSFMDYFKRVIDWRNWSNDPYILVPGYIDRLIADGPGFKNAYKSAVEKNPNVKVTDVVYNRETETGSVEIGPILDPDPVAQDYENTITPNTAPAQQPAANTANMTVIAGTGTQQIQDTPQPTNEPASTTTPTESAATESTPPQPPPQQDVVAQPQPAPQPQPPPSTINSNVTALGPITGGGFQANTTSLVMM